VVELVAQMPPDIQAEVWAFAQERAITPDSDERAIRKLVAFARPKVPKGPSQKPQEAPAAPDPQSEAPRTLQEAAQADSGDSGGTTSPPDGDDPVDELLDRYEALHKDRRDEVDAWMAKELITWADLNSDDELHNRVEEFITGREPATAAS
jgi:hypothetical protein